MANSKSKLTTDQLDTIASVGQRHASEALSKMAGLSVKVETDTSNAVNPGDMKDALQSMEEESVVAYTQAISGVSGTSIISISRPRALKLVDLFNRRKQGTTVVMQEIDRSTIQETLNILANSYVTEMGKQLEQYVQLTVPRLVTSGRMEDLIEKAIVENDEQAVLFKTRLIIDELDFEIDLYFHFYFLTTDSDED